MTQLTGRPPTSFTVSNYNEWLWWDSEPWGGLTINYTQLTGRDPVQMSYLLDIGDWTYLMIDDTNFLLLKDTTFWTTLTGRIIPN